MINKFSVLIQFPENCPGWAKKDGPEQPQIFQAAPMPVHIYNYQQPLIPGLPGAAGAPHLELLPKQATCLIPIGHEEGIKYNLPTFCEIYNISLEILERLQENRITGSHAFGHLTADDLKDMGLKLGEIIDLKHAVKEWSQKGL